MRSELDIESNQAELESKRRYFSPTFVYSRQALPPDDQAAGREHTYSRAKATLSVPCRHTQPEDNSHSLCGRLSSLSLGDHAVDMLFDASCPSERSLAHLLVCHERNKTFVPLSVFYELYEISGERARVRSFIVVLGQREIERKGVREGGGGGGRVPRDEKSNMNSRRRKEDAAVKGNVKVAPCNANSRAIGFANLRNEDHREGA